MANNFQITISAVDKMTDVVRKINASVDKMMAPFDNLTKSVRALGKEAGLNRLVKGLVKVEQAAMRVSRQIGSIIAPLTAIIGIGSIAGIAALATGFGKVALALSNQAALIGTSTQELQHWQGAAKLVGLSAEDVAGAMSAVGEKMDNAFRTPETVRDINAIGIGMHRLQNGSIDTSAALLDLAGAMEKQGNVETKKRIAEAFGVSSLLPLLLKGKVGVQALLDESKRDFKVFTPEQIARGVAFEKQMQAFDQQINTLKNSLGVALLPAFERVAAAVGRLVDKYGDVIATRVAEYAERLAQWLDKTDWSKVADDVAKFVDALGGAQTIAIALAAITFAAPLAGLVSLVAQVAKLSALLLPLVANPVVVGILALTHSQGLNEGEADELAKHRAGMPGYDAQGRPIGAAAGAGAAPAAPIAMGDRQKYLLDRLKRDGYSDAQSSGIVGSLMQESDLDPQANNAKTGAAGIGQWLGPRKKEFERQYGHGLEQSSFGEQTNFMLWELNNTEKRAGGLLRRASTPELAAQIHSTEYERPGADEANIGRRQSNAAGIYAALGKSNVLASANAPVATANSGVPASGAPGASGSVQVMVRFAGAPKGTSASVESIGAVTAQVASSTVTGGQL